MFDLFDATEFFRMSFGSLPNPVVVLEENMTIVYNNASFSSLLEIEDSQFRGVFCGEVFECTYVKDERGVEFSSTCRNCYFRKIVMKSFSQKRSFSKNHFVGDFKKGREKLRNYTFDTNYFELKGQEFVMVKLTKTSESNSLRIELEQKFHGNK